MHFRRPASRFQPNAPLGQGGFTAPGSLFYTYQSTNLFFNGEPLNLQTACIPLLKHSENVMADGLLRHVGYRTRGEDSYSAGAAAVGDWLSGAAKVNTNALSIRDGSGFPRRHNCNASMRLPFCDTCVAQTIPNLPGRFPFHAPTEPWLIAFAQPKRREKCMPRRARSGSARLERYVANTNGTPRYWFSFIANNTGGIDLNRTRETIDEAVTELAVRH